MRATLRSRVVRRAGSACAVLLAVSALGSLLLDRLPGGADGSLGADPTLSAPERAAARAANAPDSGWRDRYLTWLRGAARGDLGRSTVTGEPVARLIAERLPASLELLFATLLVALPAAFLIGAAGAARRGALCDRLLSGGALLVLSLPGFCLALGAIGLFAVRLRWLPAGGRTAPDGEGGVATAVAHLILPAIVLGAGAAARWSRFARAGIAATSTQPAFVMARAKGIPRGVLWWRHAVAPAIPRVAAVVALDLPALLAGAVVTETVFGWPGLGRLFQEGIQRRDDPSVMGLMTLAAAVAVGAGIAAELLECALDPRVGRTEGA